MDRILTIFLLSETAASSLVLSGLSSVGGDESSGMVVAGLKSADDYAVLSPDGDGVSIHPLKGKTKGPLRLRHLETTVIGDLRLLLVVSRVQAKIPRAENLSEEICADKFIQGLQALTTVFAEPQNWGAALDTLLRTLSEQFLLEKGLLIARNAKNSYDIVARLGVATGDPWLSKTLIDETLRLRQPRFVHNLVGSEFESKKSLIATGFVSVFAWPLILRGEILGVLLLGSTKPHSGLTPLQQTQLDTYARLATMVLHFHLRDQHLKEEIENLRANLTPSDYPLLTQDPALLETCRLASQVSASNLAVLIQGETGVGKELLANWIHSRSDRKQKPFIAVNCGAIPSELLESLLFGHRKGAFTGASQDQIGKFQQAHGGTLFLDEIGDLPEALQVKLLRTLQEGVVEPLGANRTVAVDVRIVAATHRRLPERIAEGKFREDLYYRLAEITLTISPLRNRGKDIGLLAAHFLKIHAPEKRFARSAWQWLQAQEWRGNVRELASSVKRASILSTQIEIEREDFLRGHSGLSAQTSVLENAWLGGATLEAARDRFVQSKIEEALRRSEGKRKEAADLLGINTRTLFRYLEERRSHGGDMTELSHDSDKGVSP